MTDLVRGQTDGGKEAANKTISLVPLAEVDASLWTPHILAVQLILLAGAGATIAIMGLHGPSWLLTLLP